MARLLPFLATYYQPDDPAPVFEGALELWKKSLLDLPKAAVDKAIDERSNLPTMTRPRPGEIRAAALRHVRNTRPALEDRSDEDKELVTYAEALKLAKAAGQMGNPLVKAHLANIRERDRSARSGD